MRPPGRRSRRELPRSLGYEAMPGAPGPAQDPDPEGVTPPVIDRPEGLVSLLVAR